MYCFICKKKIIEDEKVRYTLVAENKEYGDKTYFCYNCVIATLRVIIDKIFKERHEILFRRF